MSKLPAQPSAEHLRKQAKRFARERSIRLSEAQQSLARDYGFRNWAALMHSVEATSENAREAAPPLVAAVRSRDLAAVHDALAGGANPRSYYRGETPLHAAVRNGALAVAEALIAGGALEWQTDSAGRTALDVARAEPTAASAAMVALLDRTAIADASFRDAVAAIHVGDVRRLVRLLDAQPHLLDERIVGAQAYRERLRTDYFRDPKLFWFVANNPTTVEGMPANIVAVAGAMIERGVERADFDYTLELVMTSSAAREEGHQLPLMDVLLAAGARATLETVVAAAAHKELDGLRALAAAGRSPDAPLTAALGDVAALRILLPQASRHEIALAFGLAVINRNVECTRLTLAAGADVNMWLPVHTHSTALHQAAIDNDGELIDLLLESGARRDVRDRLWDGTPREWATFGGHAAAVAQLGGDEPQRDDR